MLYVSELISAQWFFTAEVGLATSLSHSFFVVVEFVVHRRLIICRNCFVIGRIWASARNLEPDFETKHLGLRQS